jgi:hypothetical protein
MTCRDYKSFVMLGAWVFVFGIGAHIATGAAEQSPKEVIQRLSQPETRMKACDELRAMGDRATDAMIEGLKSPNQDIRYQLALLLGEAKCEKAIDALIRLAQNKEYPDAYGGALKALGQIGGPEAAKAIIAALPQLHPTGQEDYCRILGEIGDNRAIEPLIKLLMSTDGEEPKQGEGLFKIRARTAAAEALGKFRDPRVRAALVKAIADDPDWEVYHAARQSLCRIDAQTYFPGYEDLRTTILLAVAKRPEPAEGAKEAVRKWHKENQNYQGAWSGPMLEDYASSLDIERARDTVVQIGKEWPPDFLAGGVIEILMEYLRNLKFYIGPENAKALLIRIGGPAIPALQNGVKRGDPVLVRNCDECIRAINIARQPTNGVSPKRGTGNAKR